MAATLDPETGSAPPPVIRGEARLLLPRDPARATAVLYRKYSTTVYRFAWHMLGNREDAEDATQAAFLSIHSALAGGTPVREPHAWVLKIARNECLARITQRMRRPLTDSLDDDTTAQVAASIPSVPRQVEIRDDIGVASEALGRLPTSQREAFVLREWMGLSTSEIAVSLGTTVSAVDALLNRARRELIRVVGGAEGAASCSETRRALSDGLLDRPARAHLVRCKQCRAVRRVLRPQLAAARMLVPPAAIAARLADALPGFATHGAVASGAAGSAAATAGGGGIAAIVAKAAATPAALKGAMAVVAAAAAVGGGVAVETRSSQHATTARTAGVVSAATPTRGTDAVAVAVSAPTAASTPVRGDDAVSSGGGSTGDSSVGSRGGNAEGGSSASAGSPDGGTDGSDKKRKEKHDDGIVGVPSGGGTGSQDDSNGGGDPPTSGSDSEHHRSSSDGEKAKDGGQGSGGGDDTHGGDSGSGDGSGGSPAGPPVEP